MVNQINNPTLENAVGGNGASSAAAAKDDDDMSVDIEIGTVDDADEYTIDQSHADGGGRRLAEGLRRPSVRRLLLAHPSQ